jgi:hypothetical protein
MPTGHRTPVVVLAILLALATPAPAGAQPCGPCAEQCEVAHRSCRAAAAARGVAVRTFCIQELKLTRRSCAVRFATARRACRILCATGSERQPCVETAREERDDCRDGLAAQLAQCRPIGRAQRDAALAGCDGDRATCLEACP